MVVSVLPPDTAPKFDISAADKHIQHLYKELDGFKSRIYGAAIVNRLTADWYINVTSANAEIFISRKAAISRARQLERDNPYMRRALRIKENNVVGAYGIGLQMQIRLPGATANDKEPPLDRDLSVAVQKAWVRAGRKENCTTSRTFTRKRLCNLVVRSLSRDGGILLRKRRGFKNEFNWALEPIEIDRLDHDLNRPAVGQEGHQMDGLPGTNKIQFGIEFNDFDEPQAYHILYRHPGEVFNYRSSPLYRERVPADEIICIFTPERAGQFVGMPEACGIMVNLNHLGRYDEAEVVAARVAACKGGFLQKKVSEGYSGKEDALGNISFETQPGLVEDLPMGYEFKEYNPNHPTESYPHFVKQMLRGMACGFNLSYHTLANDLESISFSSIRQGTLEDREEFKSGQQDLIDDLLTPWFEEWVLFALMSGKIPGASVLDVQRIRDAVNWKPRTWDWVDPLTDVQADAIAVKEGFTSRRRVVRDYTGEDVEVIDHENQEDKENAEAHSLNYNSNPLPGLPTGTGQAGRPPAGFEKAAVFVKNGSRHSVKLDSTEWKCDKCSQGGITRGEPLCYCPNCGTTVQSSYVLTVKD